MRSLAKKQTTFYGILTTIGCLVVGVGSYFAFTPPAKAQSIDATSGDRLITVHDSGVDRAFMTRAATLRQALQQANFTLDPKDTVEPSLDSQLVAANYEVNVYRARPITIIDGAVRQKVLSSARTADQIAKVASITLYPEDTTNLDVNTGVNGDAGLQMTITRATPFTFTLYGKTLTARTQAKTVGAMLKEKNITLDKDDRVSVDQSASITPDLTVRVWREGKQTITVDEPVPFTTDQVKDADQPVGYKQVQTPGASGSQSVTYEVTIQDGKEVSRNKIASIVTKETVKQVEVIGTKVSLPPGSHTDWLAAAGVDPGNYGYIDYIFSHESGWRPNAVSGNGYVGLGQTSLSNLSSACPNWQSDPICQIIFFSRYSSRYGGWAGSYNFWSTHHWW